ncbi:MAG: hypothetical protein HUJ25_05505 [Crocinitomicaceae bacterium]|nr:hypothetical protein [Crocinitomicaceae bacterium]
MKFKSGIYFIITLVIVVACNKVEPPDDNGLPDGATPYTESDIQFVPYTSGNKVFKRMPALDSTLILEFKERIRTEEYFAWDQTFFTLSVDSELELELRLRYLQTEDESQKTLALYMPYRDGTSQDSIRQNVFEMPIDPTNLSNSFFQNHIVYHDTIIISSVEWYDVYEVNELVSTDPGKDGPTNFDKIFYNKIYGIIRMNQKNGTDWVLQQ